MLSRWAGLSDRKNLAAGPVYVWRGFNAVRFGFASLRMVSDHKRKNRGVSLKPGGQNILNSQRRSVIWRSGYLYFFWAGGR